MSKKWENLVFPENDNLPYEDDEFIDEQYNEKEQEGVEENV